MPHRCAGIRSSFRAVCRSEQLLLEFTPTPEAAVNLDVDLGSTCFSFASS